VQCEEAEIPQWIRDAAIKLKDACIPPPAGADKPAAAIQAKAAPAAMAADGT
jgi:putative ATP-dependent endonuclease of the OLD family